MMANTTPEKVGLSSKNPFGDFSNFEHDIEKMQPLMPEETAQNLAKQLIGNLKNKIETHSVEKKVKVNPDVTQQLKSLTQQVEKNPNMKSTDIQ